MTDSKATGTTADLAPDRASHTARIVVGVDGSDGSLGALRWALTEARIRGGTVHVVVAYPSRHSRDDLGLGSMFPLGFGMSGGAGLAGIPVVLPGTTEQPGQVESLEKALDSAISHLLERDADDLAQSVEITREFVEGHAAKALLDTVGEDDLLVVGSRGHGGFIGLLLGSVSQHLVSHAPCPVVVVRSPAPPV